MRCTYLVAVGLVVLSQICGCKAKREVPPRLTDQQIADAKLALEKLQAADFEQAGKEADLVLKKDPNNSQARVVAAITAYKKTMHNFINDMQTNLGGMFAARAINHRYIKWSLDQADQGLAKVEEHLAVAARDSGYFMYLCLACWEYDWNHSGQVDDRDRLLLQIEVDAQGNPYPKNDPRRKPTFRFDHGDIYWARAMVAFQRAFMNLLMAYQLPDFDQFADAGQTSILTIKMVDKTRVHKARDLILAGLDHADQSRMRYMTENDDEAEWLPNPNQKNHPLPLPVDRTLYSTWEGVLYDLQWLIKGEYGISVVEVAQLGDHQWDDPPTGYINVAKLLEEPGDITLNLNNLGQLGGGRTKEDVERVLKDIFGDKYVPKMKPTKLISRLSRMKTELERGEDTFERKLRYLLWVN